jgi:DNA processing protein
MNAQMQFVVSSGRAPRYTPPSASSTLEHDTLGVLYLAGNVRLLEQPCVAIVGSRSPSREGAQQARAAAEALASRGIVIVSGLAAGIDAMAHEGALRVGGSIVAVVGTPLDRAYPAENAALQEHIYRNHLLLSPFLAGSRTSAWHFPARNRVIARLSVATVLVDAEEKSGTRHVIEECARAQKVVFARRGLLERLSWLRHAAERTTVHEWDRPDELALHLT